MRRLLWFRLHMVGNHEPTTVYFLIHIGCDPVVWESGAVLHFILPSLLPQSPALKAQCTKGPQRRITRWENEHVVDAVQARLDKNPDAMRTRRETVEHPFGTLKMRMGATHFLMKTLPKVATEMALHVLAYNLTRVMNIVGIKPLLVAIRA
jgi:Transposase DDE domain